MRGVSGKIKFDQIQRDKNMNTNRSDIQYREYYLILGLVPGCSWIQVKSAYKKLAQRHHPDRFEAGTREHQSAAENFKALQNAYKALSSYHQTNGALPEHQSERHASRSGEYVYRKTTCTEPLTKIIKPQKPHASLKRPLLFSLLLWPVLYACWKSLDSPDTRKPPFSAMIPTKTTESLLSSTQHFTQGDTLETVLKAQGEPQQTDGDTWFYGDSKVFFKDGRVIDWISSPESPLNTQ